MSQKKKKLRDAVEPQRIGAKHPIQAVGDHILVDRAEKTTVTSGGIILPDKTTEDPPCWGVVISTGPEVKGVAVGDVVFFNDQESNNLPLPDGHVLVLREMCVYARCSTDEAMSRGLTL